MSIRSRREFARFLAGSPLLASSLAAQQDVASFSSARGGSASGIITDPKDALSVLDFEAAARQALPPAHFGYLATGVDDDATLQANRTGYQQFQLRPRRMVDVSQTDLSVDLFGTRWQTPIVLSPVGSQRAFHPDGEIAVARAGKAKRTLQILSTATTASIEEVTAAAGQPVWYQLYPTTNWAVTEKLVKRAEAAGSRVLVVTTDLPAGRNTETAERFKRLDKRQCSLCHDGSATTYFKRKPMFDSIDMSGTSFFTPAMTWEWVKRFRDLTKMKVVLKGIVSGEDAALCVKYGVDGLIVSNHGGRAEESNRGTIECLPEVTAAVNKRIPVLLDGGIRRGTDVFKALALGARAVCIGRPYVWGLGAFGQPGVERVLDILRGELTLVMKQCGARTVAEITAAAVTARR
ncbi:MAG: alpha-hydroxy acid oxidase [Acidobacteria bacterium]|nr:alpha-hydroxy acid oxidase [Acidobacteriota bacterium]